MPVVNISGVGRGLRWVLTALTVFLSNTALHAQSCALCYTQVAGGSHRLIQGLRTGILVLIVPPMFMSVAITWLAYKKRNRTNALPESDKSENDW